MKPFHYALGLVVCLGTVACGSATRNEVQSRQQPSTRTYEPEGLVANSLANAERDAMQIQNTGPLVDSVDYPWQVGLVIAKNGKWYQCGGTLVTPQYVLTAAHCLDQRDSQSDPSQQPVAPQDIEIYHGTTTFGAGPKLAADLNWQPQLHPKWKSNFQSKKFLYDAALIRLAQPIAGTTVAPVRTAPVSVTNAIVSGWGRFSQTSGVSADLRAVTVTTVDNSACAAQLPPPEKGWVDAVTLCTRTPRDDACSGDSGGPLVIGSRTRPQLVGVVSWGLPLPCAVPGPSGALIGAYTRASAIAAWVASATGDPRSVTNATPEPLMSLNPKPQAGGINQ
jgi:hypothetical protein